MTSADKYQDQVYHLSRRVEELEELISLHKGELDARLEKIKELEETILKQDLVIVDLNNENTLLRQIVEEMKHEMQTAIKYLHDTYPNYEDGLPEIGMRIGFERCLASVEEKLRGLK
jgi:chromosome segregation ATPase